MNYKALAASFAYLFEKNIVKKSICGVFKTLVK
jgi:hypothetical protein